MKWVIFMIVLLPSGVHGGGVIIQFVFVSSCVQTFQNGFILFLSGRLNQKKI